jgi:methyl-accepting chemotaxis protein
MFSHMRIGNRLMVLVTLQCLVLLAVALTGLTGVAHTKDRLHNVYEESIVPLLYLDNLLNQDFQARAQLEEAFNAGSPADAQKHLRRLAAFGAEAEKVWKEYNASAMSAEERKLADEVGQAHQGLVAARDQVTAAFAAEGRAAATEVDKRVDRIAKFDQWREKLDKLIEFQAREAESGYKEADGDYREAKWAVIGALLLGVGIAGVLSWMVIRSLTGPLHTATAIAGRIAQGDLTASIDESGRDEIAVLLQAFARMQLGLRDMVAQINNGVAQLFSATVQLSATAKQLSASSETQSGAAASVASSVEEVTVSIAKLPERAEETQTISTQASRASHEGAEIVNQSTSEITSIAKSVDRAA